MLKSLFYLPHLLLVSETEGPLMTAATSPLSTTIGTNSMPYQQGLQPIFKSERNRKNVEERNFL
ncbi:hypothetical protein SAMN05444266_109100 [Chitinophaga jiangningensis]|uniref:Uncharacterized protein n=1 Tax=Chitinophaga jiangningensis TaxID=1419482 RepID=A0A1M7K0Z0_9BACT|nr:hypothetical protein SAMN05444266_109100 [Chitinophaga jiangningensis]